ncbi:uncharacterized mitochondrial protein-like protein [Tanacetum coccineum]
MKDDFEMLMIGEMKFFLGLQVHQSPRGIFICQSQYTMDLLKKHGMEKCDTISTPMATTKLDADLQGTQVDQTKYHSMIGGLMYLYYSSRSDIAFATFVCARYQARPTKKHLKEVKRIFRYLRQTINMGIWYSKDYGFELIVYLDADLVGCNDDCKSTSGGIQFMGDKLVSWSSKKQDCTAMSTAEAEYEHVEKGTIELYFVGTEYQLADLFTKALSKESISYGLKKLVPAAQLVPRYHTIGRCNNYVVLQSIPCSLECKIVGKILLDHPLSYALTATADVPVVYLQQFWRTVSKVPDTEDTIKFMLDTKEFTYTVDMFRVTLHLPVETPENHLCTVFNRCLTTRTSGHDQTKINILQLFHVMINQTNVDYAALLWIDEDYHSIKDDIPLVSVYTNRNVLVRGMSIPDEFLTEKIHATDDFKEYKTVFVGVDVSMNQPQPVVSTQGTHRSTPRAHKTPIVSTASPQGTKRKQIVGKSSSPRKSHKITIRKKKQSTTLIPPPGDDRERDEVAEATILSLTLQKTALAAEAQEYMLKYREKLDEEEIEKMVEGDEDKESYASKFVDSMINDDVDDSCTRLEPGSHKEHSEIVNDDDDRLRREEDEGDEK